MDETGDVTTVWVETPDFASIVIDVGAMRCGRGTGVVRVETRHVARLYDERWIKQHHPVSRMD